MGNRPLLYQNRHANAMTETLSKNQITSFGLRSPDSSEITEANLDDAPNRVSGRTANGLSPNKQGSRPHEIRREKEFVKSTRTPLIRGQAPA
jgi:hypothetical protein